MSQFQLFDSIRLTEALSLEAGVTASIGSPGAVVEMFNNGEAYLVELFGRWVMAEVDKDFSPADSCDSNFLIETIGLATVYPYQIDLIKSAGEINGIRSQLLVLMDELPEAELEKVRDFAEFIKSK